MPTRCRQLPRECAIAFVVGLLLASTAHAQLGPKDWLNRMAAAVQTTSYEGTVIRIQDDNIEVLKVVHTIEDGVVREKVVAQEGSGIEIIRIGNEVHGILPDRQSVLVEEWDDQSTLFSTLPTSEVRFGSEYDAAIVSQDRIAGREAVQIAIRPHDSFRYGHRIWLDTATAFPLQTQLIDETGDAIEQVKFADIVLDQEIHASLLAPSYSTEHFTWLRQSNEHVTADVLTDWVSTQLPAGFQAVTTHQEVMQSSDKIVLHIVFSDGLANVSVFIAEKSGNLAVGPARVGGSNSYSVESDDSEITAIGEVPALTVRQIANSMQRR